MSDCGPLLRGRLGSFARILGSGLAVNISTFVVLAIAPIALSTESFATLTLVVAGILFGATLLDLGLSTTTVRQFAATKDERIIGTTLRTRLAVLAAATAVAIAAFFIPGSTPFATAALGAGFLNVWSGLRSIDLAREDHATFADANLAMSAARIVCGGVALLSRSWLWVAVALFVIPVMVVAAVRTRTLARDLSMGDFESLRTLLGYSAFVYVSALAYNACVYLPQAMAAAHLDDIAVGSLGIASTLVAPLILVNAALRAMLLSRISAGGTLTDELGLRPGIASALGVIAVIAILFGVVIVAQFVYGSRFPDIGLVTGAILAGYIVILPLGLINMAVHRIGRPQFEAAVNVARLLGSLPMLWLAASSTIMLAAAAALLLIVGEIALYLVIRRAISAPGS